MFKHGSVGAWGEIPLRYPTIYLSALNCIYLRCTCNGHNFGNVVFSDILGENHFGGFPLFLHFLGMMISVTATG